MFEVRVPATSANLGPGFDTLGIALRLYGEFIFKETTGPEDTKHLALKAYRQALRQLDAEGVNLHVHVSRTIPVGKGLGSSAACIVAGVMAAYHVAKKEISPKELLKTAAGIEGHPDNVTPAFLGGLIASSWEGGEISYGALPLSKKLSFALLIPTFSLPTAKARKALPAKLSFKDAAFNLSQLGLTISALGSGEEDLLTSAFQDRLHQPYRFQLIEDSLQLIDLAKKRGALAVALSGAGPSLLLIRRKRDPLQGLQEDLQKLKKRWKLRLLEADRHGAKLKVLP